MKQKIVTDEFLNNLKTKTTCPVCKQTATINLQIRYGKIKKYVYDCNHCGNTLRPAV